MKWFLMCAVLLGMSLPAYAQDEPKPALDTLENSFIALRLKHYPLAVRDVVSKDEASGYMSIFAHCAALWSVRYDYLQDNNRDYKQPEGLKNRASSERLLAILFGKGYSADPEHEVDVAIRKARSYYEPLLKVEYDFEDEAPIKLKEASLKMRECVKHNAGISPIFEKVEEKLEERMKADPVGAGVAMKFAERIKRDPNYAIEFSKRLGVLN